MRNKMSRLGGNGNDKGKLKKKNKIVPTDMSDEDIGFSNRINGAGPKLIESDEKLLKRSQ